VTFRILNCGVALILVDLVHCRSFFLNPKAKVPVTPRYEGVYMGLKFINSYPQHCVEVISFTALR
jgi:hypothetical protein